ncbi:MAG: O-antigen ligase family protein [Chloroflexota bacterium]|nr:O-antigen ligase family protein [Chloroflexota bacterium]
MAATFERARTRRALLWLAAAKIVLVVLVFDPRGDVPFDLPKSLASRASEWATVAVLLVALLAYGPRLVPRARLHWAVAWLAAVSAVAAIFAAEPYVAVFGEVDRYLGLTYLADMIVLYLAVAVAVRSDRDVTFLLGAVGTAGIVTSGYAVLQTLGADPFAWAVDPRGRPFATFGNPDQLGHFLSVLFGLAFGAAIATTRGRRKAVALAGVLAVVGIAAVVATRGTLVGISAVLAGSLVDRRPTRRVALVATAATLVLGAMLLATPLGQRAIGTVQAGTLPDRIALYGIAVRATLARPLFGYGPDNFRAAFVEHRTAESLPILSAGPQTSAHDWLLDASATTGLVGLAALLALVGLGTLELRSLARERPGIGLPLLFGWLAYWANALVSVGSIAVGWYPWLAIGAVVALRAAPSELPVRQVPRWVGPAIAIVTVVAIATGTRAFLANQEAWAATEALHFGDTNAAIASADRAAARDGGRAGNWNRLGLAFEAEQRWAEAAVAYRAATTKERHEAVYWANLARALTRIALTHAANSEDEAIAAASEAVRTDPNAPLGHIVLAEVATAFGRCAIARDEAARAAVLVSGQSDLVARAAACR